MGQQDLERAISELIERLNGSGADFSAVLYGSAARGDWAPGRSDVNLLLVVADASPTGLRRLTPSVVAWHTAGFTPPLIIGRDEWLRADDVFPIEITDMRSAYRVLAGDDPVVGLRVGMPELRRALETELRGKLVRLRQAYVRFGEAPQILGGFATASVSALMVLLRSTAVLLGKAEGQSAAETLDALAGLPGIDAAAVLEVVSHRRDGEWACPPETFVRYLETVRSAVDAVDHHQPGVA